MPEVIKEKLTSQENTVVPFVYLKNSLSSSFLVNFWDDLMTIAIALCLAFILSSLEKVLRAFNWVYLTSISSTLTTITKWNFPLMVLAINIDDIILFSAIQYKTSEDSLSLAFSVIFILIILALMGLISFIAFSLRKSPSKKFTGFQVLYSAFRTNNIFNQLFFLFYMLRIALPIFLAVCFESYPLLVSIPQVLISLIILGYILRMKPFTKKTNHFQMIIFESTVLVLNCCMLTLTILSHYGLQNHNTAIILGDIVILGNDCLNIMCLFFLLLQIHTEAACIQITLTKTPRGKPQRLGMWCRLLFFLLQQGNMGFEELVYYPETAKPKRKSEILYLEEEDRANLDFSEEQANLVRKRPIAASVSPLSRTNTPKSRFHPSRSGNEGDGMLSKRETAETYGTLEKVILIQEEDGAGTHNETSDNNILNSKRFIWRKQAGQGSEKSLKNLHNKVNSQRKHEEEDSILIQDSSTDPINRIGSSMILFEGIANKTTAESNIFEKSLLKNWRKDGLGFSISNQDSIVSNMQSDQDRSRIVLSPVGSTELPLNWRDQDEEMLPQFGGRVQQENSKRSVKRQGSLAYDANLKAKEKKKIERLENREDDEAVLQRIQKNLESLNKIIEEEDKPKVRHDYLRKSGTGRKGTVFPEKSGEEQGSENFSMSLWKKGKHHFKPN